MVKKYVEYSLLYPQKGDFGMSTNERWINDRQTNDQQTSERQINERQTVVGVFPTHTQAENAINELHRFGFTDQQIGYVVREASGNTRGNIPPNETHTAQNAVGGAVSGGVIGGLVGAASSLLIPGFGPAIAGGILAATLGGAAIGAVAGGLIGALTQLGVPEDEAYYSLLLSLLLVSSERLGKSSVAMELTTLAHHEVPRMWQKIRHMLR